MIGTEQLLVAGSPAELPTPFLTVDLEAVERNILRMQEYCDAHGLGLRPHVKTHKMPEMAQRQLAAGARGLTCQKLGEAETMVAAGCGDILITFPLIGVGKAERFAALAGEARIAVAADSEIVARHLSAALMSRGTSAGFLVECDTGFGRTGVQTPEQAADLAEAVDRLPGLEFRGLLTHPTLPTSGPWLARARETIERRGLEVGCISGGGTQRARLTHEVEEITELRVGTYIYGDRTCLVSGVATLETCALRVVATVVSRPTRDRAIIDAGSKTLTSDPLGATPQDDLFGGIVEYPSARIYQLSEEHGHVDVSACDPAPAVGDVVTVIPNHACATVNLHSEVALHRAGASVTVAAVPARGLVR